MAGIVGLIKAKPLKPVINAIENNPYGMATKFPEEPDRLFDGELKLLLMDGYSYIPYCYLSNEVVSRNQTGKTVDE